MGTAQAAWTLNRLVSANALSFDIRVQSLTIGHAYTDRESNLVRQVCEAIIDPADQSAESADCHTELHRRVQLAGFVIPNLCHAAPLARRASVLETGPTLRAAIAV